MPYELFKARTLKEFKENKHTIVITAKKDNFFFAIEKPVRGTYKTFHKLLLKLFPSDEVQALDLRYNKLVNKYDRIHVKESK